MAELAEDLAAAPRDVLGTRDAMDVNARPSPAESGATHSLIADLEALFDDGRTYFDAELRYQKSRASFVADRVKKTLVFAIGAAVVGLLAAIGLIVGLIIALTPLVTGWGATAIVVGALLVIAYLLIRRAARNWAEITRVTGADNHDGGNHASDG